MAEKGDDRHDLGAMFAAARQRPVDVPDDLMARVLADAEAVQPVSPGLAVVAPPPSRLGARLGRWVALVGGWRTVSGLVPAGVARFLLGFGLSPVFLPEGLDSLTGAAAASYLSELSADFGLDIAAEEG